MFDRFLVSVNLQFTGVEAFRAEVGSIENEINGL